MVISRKYEVQGQLGRGSMSVVYKVRHTTLDTLSALKVLPPQLADPELVKRFYREARVMARLNHPNIVRVIDIDRDEALQFPYFVMEYIQGQTLREYLQKKGPLPLVEVLKITWQIARALDYAHSYTPAVIHRDIKPSNIMIEDGSGRVVVMDFGIAKELGESDLTKAETMLGTVKYCPPEQIRHEPLDSSADVYALGMVIYEAYTGIQFFAGLGEHEVMDRVLDLACENEPRFTRPAPVEFVALVTKAIAKSRDKRYRRMADLLRDLEAGWPNQSDQKSIRAKPQPERGRDELKELEKQIHQLEEERQQHLAARLQEKVREVREQAAHEGSGHLASALFQQGLTQEESGLDHLRRQQYALAQEAYKEAAGLYAQAYEQAAATALAQRAEQARQAMTVVRVEADHYGAVERAHTSYGRGLTLQAQAEELWDSKAYEQALRLYDEALSVFEEARDISYRTLLKEEARAAQDQMNAARELALRERAEELAPQTFEQALRSEQRAGLAVNSEEFTQARELYRAACQHYELAEQQARTERQRQQALSAQQQAQEAQHKAEAAGASSERSWYRQAREAQDRGDAQLQGEAYEQAAQGYEQARAGYERARQEAEHARRRQAAEEERCHQQALSAQQEAEQSREAAEEAQAQQYAQGRYQRAMETQRQGEQSLTANRWEEATEAFVETSALFGESLEEVKRARAKQSAEVGQANALAAQQEAQAGKGAELFPERFAEAEALLGAGEQRLKYEDFDTARATFERSAVLFRQIGQEAVVALQRAQTEQARSHAEEWQRRTSSAKGRPWRRAHKILKQGDRLVQQGNYTEAEARYEQAASLFTALQKTAPAPLPKRKRMLVALAVGISSLALIAVIGARYLVLQKTPHETPPDTTHPPSTVPPLVDAKPVLAWSLPDLEGEIPLAEGQTQTFIIQAESPQGSPLRYAWFLDGKKQAEGEQWTYQPNFTEAETKQPKEVKVTVTGQDGRTIERTWQVRVTDINRPPKIEAISPQTDTLELTVGEQREFSVQAFDPDSDDPLVYGWFLDGRKVGEGERWQFQASSPETPHSVTVAVMDKGGLKDQRAWEIRVKPLPPPPVWLEITEVRPKVKPGQAITVSEGQTQTFVIQAESPQGGPLRYAWFLDGKKQADGEQWTYRPDSTEAGTKPKEVKAVVTDQEGHRLEKVWRVRVRAANRPPEITRASPADTELGELPADGIQNFSIEVSDPDQDDRLVYVWSLDGREVGRSQRWQLRAPLSEGRHTVRVEVLDKAGLKAQRTWNVAVQAPSLPPEITDIKKPEADIKKQEVGIGKAEVLDWLEIYRRAWEKRSVDTLVRLGEVTSQHAPKLREVLLGYKDFRVALEDVQIRIEGAQATVTLRRVDIIDGKALPQPDRKVFVLEKQADGRLVRRGAK